MGPPPVLPSRVQQSPATDGGKWTLSQIPGQNGLSSGHALSPADLGSLSCLLKISRLGNALPHRELRAQSLHFLDHIVECVSPKQQMQRWFGRSQELRNHSAGFGWIAWLMAAPSFARLPNGVENG